MATVAPTALAARTQPSVFRRVMDAITGRPAPKSDSWANYVTGAGTWGRDKTRHTFMEPVRALQYAEIESLYYGDWVSARIIEARPKEYFRRGFELEDADDQIEKDCQRLEVKKKFRQGVTYARAWGGAGCVCNVDDGLPVDQPVNLANSRGVKWMNVVDRRYLNPISYYDDPSQANFGLPRIYEVTPAFGQSGMNILVHESRIIRFVGTEVDAVTSRRLAGWSYSALQRPYDVIRRIAQTYQAAGQLMYDVGQGVLKVSNLFDALTGPSGAAVLNRIMQADSARWAGRTVAVDKEGEDFTRVATPLAGVPEMMDRLLLELAGASETPLTRLLGREPAGLNATGASDLTYWYETVGNEQVNDVEPALVKLLMMLTAGKWDGSINWLGLERANELVEAQVKTERAKYWQILEDVGAVSGEQIAMVELLGEPVEDVVDEKTLRVIIKAEYEMAKEPQPLPPPPLVSGVPIVKGSLASQAQGNEPMGQALPGAAAPKALPPAKKDRKPKADHIVERGGKWVLLSKKDPNKVLGTFTTKEEAEKRESEIIAAESAKGE